MKVIFLLCDSLFKKKKKVKSKAGEMVQELRVHALLTEGRVHTHRYTYIHISKKKIHL